MLAAVRVIVREWAKRTGAPDGLTMAFIKQARRAKRLPRLTMQTCIRQALRLVELIRRQALRFDACAVQLQSEWTLDTPIADMAQMVPQRCTYGYCRAAMHHIYIYRSATT